MKNIRAQKVVSSEDLTKATGGVLDVDQSNQTNWGVGDNVIINNYGSPHPGAMKGVDPGLNDMRARMKKRNGVI